MVREAYHGQFAPSEPGGSPSDDVDEYGSPESDASEGRAGGWQYAVCLTKADKGGPQAVRRVEKRVRKAIAEHGCPEPAAIVATSSKSRAGRADMWRLMRGVVLEPLDAPVDDSDEHGGGLGWGTVG